MVVYFRHFDVNLCAGVHYPKEEGYLKQDEDVMCSHGLTRSYWLPHLVERLLGLLLFGG
jgi:hypothetical protein